MALAACVYLQNVVTREVSQLISGKTRLTPKKTVQTIPRLELLAILVVMRLAKTVTNAMSTSISGVNIASDSEIALAWIKSSRKLPPFVNNQKERISKLRAQFEGNGLKVQFYHVPTHYNPADAGTRGLTATNVTQHAWLRGPQWLKRDVPHLPIKPIEAIHERQECEPEEMVQLNVVISPTLVCNTEDQFIELTRFSQYKRVLRVIARVGKLVQHWTSRCNSRRTTSITLQTTKDFLTCSEITAEDIQLSERLLFAIEHKHIKIEELRTKFPKFNIIRDEHGIIRHESRIQNATLPLDTRSPIHVTGNSELARLILTHIHRTNAHCGISHTLAIARQRFWIPQPSRTAKKFLNSCVICKRSHGLPFGAPEMPPLPSDRVVITKPFQNVGCDFLGPYRSDKDDKMYICLYTCLTTRAVHLEVVENMTASAFLSSLVRFVSRRGVPKLIRTDCGTNFKLGQVVIEKMFEENDVNERSVMSYSASEGIKWIFNPSRRALDGWSLGKIEAILNTRPLTKVSMSDLEEIPLRPVDFLQGNIKFSLPRSAETPGREDPDFDPELIQSVTQARESLLFSENIANNFWERWNTEYLTALRESQNKNLRQPRHCTAFPQIGEIVIVDQELIPRGNWVYAKIVELVKSADGLTRSAKLLMPNQHIWQRPLNKIFPLEIRAHEETGDENGAESTAPSCEPCSEQRNHNVEGMSNQLPHEEETSSTAPLRRNQPRASKSRAYDVIQEFERSLEQTSTHFNAHASTWVTLPLLLCIINAVSAQEMINITCHNGVVTAARQNEPFQLCFNSDCRNFNASDKLIFKIPPSASNRSAEISLRPLKSNTSEVTKCAQPSYCEHAGQVMTSALLGNPHCWPAGAIITAGALVYLAITTILITAKIIKELVKSLKETNEPTTENHILQSFNPKPLRLSTVTLTLSLIAMISHSHACQHGFMRHSAELVCDNYGRCYYEYSQEVLFNRIYSELCIQIRHGNNTVGTVKITQKPINLMCEK
ncbi:hypothetical protein OESDEN_12690, partial [Oesophagostomum dentatum]